MTARHTIQCSHRKLSKILDGGMKLLKYVFVGLKGTEMIISSPVSDSSICNIQWHCVVVLLCRLAVACIGNTSQDVPKTVFKSKLKWNFSWL